MVEVELWTGGYPLNLLSLLSVLEEAVISPSFKRLRIKGGVYGDDSGSRSIWACSSGRADTIGHKAIVD